MKNTLLYTYSTNTLVGLLTVNMTQNCLTPKIMKMCDCMIVTLLKMRPHKAVPPPPPGNRVTLNHFGEKYVKTGFL